MKYEEYKEAENPYQVEKKEAYSSRAATNKQIGIASKPMIKQKMIKEKRKFK